MANKIEKYGLTPRVLELRGQGHSTTEIARIVSHELLSKDSISQRTVARFLHEMDKVRSEETRRVLTEHVREKLPGDLKALEEVETNLFNWHRDETLSLPERARFGLDMVRVIDVKLKYSGILEDPTKGPGVIHPVDLSEYKTDEDDESVDNEISTH